MSAKVYVGNLSWNTNDESLRSHFSNYGNILDSMVMRDRDTGRSRGFGFVTYINSSEAESAVGAMNEQEIDGKHVKVNLANARGAGGGGGSGGYAGGQGGYGGGYQLGGGYGSDYAQGGYSGGY